MMVLVWNIGGKRVENMITIAEFDSLYFSFDIEEDYPASLESVYCVF